MLDFYYQIKGRLQEPETTIYGSVQNWEFPPLFSGKVTAENKKAAKLLIEEEYGRQFPLRVLSKDLADNPFLLSIEEIKPGSHIASLFDQRACKHCTSTFYMIDKYNNRNEEYKGYDYCSRVCQEAAYEVRRIQYQTQQILNGESDAIIYKITNKQTSKIYIGKTTQIFTLRWYQHFFQTTDNKFHQAIKSSPVTDWTFEVIEVIDIPKDPKPSQKDIEAIVLERERYYIEKYNTIVEGYNSKA